MAWPTSNFPTSLDSITRKIDTTDEMVADDHNGSYDCIEHLEAKVGVDGSAVATSLDYLLKNTSSVDPGHKHTLANSATDVTATATELNYMDGVTSNVQTQLNTKSSISYLRAFEYKSSGTAQSSYGTGWQTMILNDYDVYGPDSGSISVNTSTGIITLPAGTYKVSAHIPIETGDNGKGQIRIRDIGAGSTLVVGMSKAVGTDDDFDNLSLVGALFTLASGTTIALQRYMNVNTTANAVNSGEIEVYSELSLEKIG